MSYKAGLFIQRELEILHESVQEQLSEISDDQHEFDDERNVYLVFSNLHAKLEELAYGDWNRAKRRTLN